MAKRERPPHRPSSRGEVPRAAKRPRPRLAVVYEDADVLVAEKPVGLATAIPPDARSAQRTLFDLVKEYVKRHGVGRPRVWVVHRLDAEVSGLVVFAKDPRAFEWLKEDLRSRRMQRVYLALVEGRFAPDDSRPGEPIVGTIQSMLVETARGEVRVLSADARPPAPAREGPLRREEPRQALTHYQVVASSATHSLLRVRLETGRKHQIRAHLSSIGHPVAGDRLYGAQTDPLGRLGLHAAELRFSHPATGQPLRFASAAPARFWKLAGREPPAPETVTPESPRPTRPAKASPGSWDEVAGWYDDLVEDRRNDLHHRVVLPGAMHLLEAARGERVLDLACGQGVLARDLAALGVRVWGVDSSPRLLEFARQRSPRTVRFEVADATRLHEVEPGFWPGEGFDAVACVMALMNMDPLSSVCAGVANLLRPGGRFVAVLLHPAFRSPGRTSWGWDESRDGTRQYRRIDAYLSPGRREIVMNPGKAVRGAKPIVTWTHHRPLQTYVQQLAAHGLLIDRLEEWPSPRRSEPGPRAEEENRARREIPMFLGLRALKIGGSETGQAVDPAAR